MSLLGIESALDTITNSGKQTSFTLGSVTFSGAEVPDAVQYGGNQNLIVHKLPGGGKVIEDGGNDPLTINFHAQFLGGSALSKTTSINKMREAGGTIPFTAAGQTWRVKIRSFTCEYRRMGFYIPYQISLEVYSSKTQSQTNPTQIFKNSLGGAIAALTNGISDVANIGGAIVGTAQSVIGQVTPIATVLGVGGPIASASNFLSKAQGITATASNLSNLPNAISGASANINASVQNLNSAISQSEQNLASISPINAASLIAVSQNSSVLQSATEAKQAARIASNLASGMGVGK